MAGAVSSLKAQGFTTVDAAESRQFDSALPIAEVIARSGEIPEIVVVHLGTNGTIDEDDANEFFALLQGVPKVIVLTVNVDKSWNDPNNALIMSLPTEFPNVSVGFWDGVAPDCTGNCFASDNLHLSADGADYYAGYIAAWSGIA